VIESQTPDNFDAPETAAEALVATPTLSAVTEADLAAAKSDSTALGETPAAETLAELAPVPVIVATAPEVVTAPVAVASTLAPSSNPLGTLSTPAPSTLPMIGALLLVVGLILVLGKLVRRVQNARAVNGATLQIKGGVQVGGKERVVWMQAGDQQLLIGVSPGRIQTLHVFANGAAAADELAEASAAQPELPAAKAAETPATRDFSDRLKSLLEHARARGVEVEHVAAPAPRTAAPSVFSFRA